MKHFFGSGAVLIAFFLGGLLLTAPSPTRLGQDIRAGLALILDDVQVVAHRGGAAVAPENTLAALERAIAEGADMVELDIRPTADGVLVAMHDDSLLRTTGFDGAVGNTDYATIAGLEAGSWFSTAFSEERVPTLPQLLAAAKGRIGLMLEIKCAAGDGDTVGAVVAELQRAGMEGTCAIACTDLAMLRRSKALAPGLDTIYIGTTLGTAVDASAYVDGYSIHKEGLTQAQVDVLHRGGKRVYLWSVNTPRELAAALALGVDGVVTDDVGQAHIQLEKQAQNREIKR